MKKITINSNLEPFYAVRVSFPDGKEFYFTTISAIYKQFSTEEIGRSREYLWNARIALDTDYDTGKCIIRKITIYRPKFPTK